MPERRLVLLASGWTGTKSSWYFFAKRFKEQGYDVVQAVYPYRGYTPIQYSARAIGELVEGVRSEYDHITFIGHSMGGLIGRYLLQRTEYAGNIDAYCSLGTPHQGSYFANLMPPIGAFGKSARQMKVGSQFLERLNSSRWPDGVPALAVSAGLDGIVWDASWDKAENITIPWTNHIAMVFDQRTFWEVWSWLTFDVLGEPGPMYHEGVQTKVTL